MKYKTHIRIFLSAILFVASMDVMAAITTTDGDVIGCDSSIRIGVQIPDGGGWKDAAILATAEDIFYCDQSPVNQAPVANAGGPYSGDVGETINFSSNGSTDTDGTITAYAWDFGDGNTSTEQNPAHAYATADSYQVALAVTDNDDATGTDTTTAIITEVLPPGGAVSFELIPSDMSNITDASIFAVVISDNVVAYFDHTADGAVYEYNGTSITHRADINLDYITTRRAVAVMEGFAVSDNDNLQIFDKDGNFVVNPCGSRPTYVWGEYAEAEAAADFIAGGLTDCITAAGDLYSENNHIQGGYGSVEATGDVDGDGIIDLLNQTELVLMGAEERIPVPLQGETRQYAVLVDIDNDTDLDIILADGPKYAAGGEVRVLRKDGSTLTDVTAASGLAMVTNHQGAYSNIIAADFNGDGCADILSAQGSRSVMQSNCDGAYTAVHEFGAYGSTFLGRSWVTAGDLTGDGIPEICLTKQDATGIDCYKTVRD